MNVSTSVPPSPPQFGPYDHLQDGQEESHNEETKVEMTVDVECHPGGMTMSPKVKSFERRIKKTVAELETWWWYCTGTFLLAS